MQDALNMINDLSPAGVLALAVGAIVVLAILFFAVRALFSSRTRSDYPRDQGRYDSRPRDDGSRGGGGGRRYRGGRR